MSLGGGGGGAMQELQQQLEALEQEKEAIEGEIQDLQDRFSLLLVELESRKKFSRSSPEPGSRRRLP